MYEPKICLRGDSHTENHNSVNLSISKLKIATVAPVVSRAYREIMIIKYLTTS